MRETLHTLRPRAGQTRSLDLVKPILRAYVFGHLSTTGPRLFNILFSLSTKWQHYPHTLSKIWSVLLRSLSLSKFPYFCALLVGSYEILQIPLLEAVAALRASLLRRRVGLSATFPLRSSRFLAAFLAAWFSLQLLNRPERADGRICRDGVSHSDDKSLVAEFNAAADSLSSSASSPLVGRTMDFTLLAAVRALESATRQAYLSLLRSSPPPRSSALSTLTSNLGPLTDALVFAASTAIIMWAWIYEPGRLPRGYSRWIASAARIDQRLIDVLRAAHRNKWIYGTTTTTAAAANTPTPPHPESILAPMCADHGWPASWADPTKTCPLPCDVVHMGDGPSCHWHAAMRFYRAFGFSLAMYLPLQLAVKARRMPGASASQRLALLLTAAREAGRSSAFLGAFIASFYYSVCLSRTLLGPRLLNGEWMKSANGDGNGNGDGDGKDDGKVNRINEPAFVRNQQTLDSGVCVGSGCVACGLSILIEAPRRRQELAYFVAPRALGTLLPRRYPREYFWRERLAFAISTGVLFTLAQEDAGRVRGVLGHLLHGVLN